MDKIKHTNFPVKCTLGQAGKEIKHENWLKTGDSLELYSSTSQAQQPFSELVLEILQKHHDELFTDILCLKNENYNLKREVDIAKKVAKKEIAASFSYDALLKNFAEVGWKGREKTIMDLNRKIRQLKDVIIQLEDNKVPITGISNESNLKKLDDEIVPIRETLKKPSEIELTLSDEEPIGQNMKIKQAIKKAKDNRKHWENQRAICRNKLNSWNMKNNKLLNEIIVIGKEIHVLCDKHSKDSNVINKLLKVRQVLRHTIHSKSKLLQKLNFLKERECDQIKLIKDLQEQLECLNKKKNEDKKKITDLKARKEQAQKNLALKETMLDHQVVEKYKMMLSPLLTKYEKTYAYIKNVAVNAEKFGSKKLFPTELKVSMTKQKVITKCGNQHLTTKKTEPESERSIKFDKAKNKNEDEKHNINAQLETFKEKCKKYETLFHASEHERCMKLDVILVLAERIKKTMLEVMKQQTALCKSNKALQIEKKRLSNHHKPPDVPIDGLINAQKMHFKILGLENKLLKNIISYLPTSNDFEVLHQVSRRNKEKYVKSLEIIRKLFNNNVSFRVVTG